MGAFIFHLSLGPGEGNKWRKREGERDRERVSNRCHEFVTADQTAVLSLKHRVQTISKRSLVSGPTEEHDSAERGKTGRNEIIP